MNPNEIQQVKNALELIVGYFGGIPEKGRGRVRFWAELAARLSRIVGLNKPWSWRYPYQVYREQTEPSELFQRAVFALGAAMDEVPTAVVYTVQVRIYARPGDVDEGSLVLGKSKPCARPGCKIRIVPNVPWRAYCSDECRDLARKGK